MRPPQFVHFGARSDFSTGRSIARPDQLARAAAHDGQPALALTDLCSLAGAPAFSAAARHLGLRPLFGIELELAPRVPAFEGRSFVRLIALNATGWKRLVRLASSKETAETEGPSHTWDDVLAEPQGLICIAGGAGSELLAAATDEGADAVELLLKDLLEAFGAERLRIALHTPAGEKARGEVDLLAAVARHFAVPELAVPEVRCAFSEDAAALRLLDNNFDGTPKTMGDLCPPRAERPHLLTAQEARRAYTDFPDAVEETLALARRIDFALPRPARPWPALQFERGVDVESFLWNKCFERAGERYGAESTRWRERLNREFQLITAAGLAPAMISLARIDDEFEQRGVQRGPGAGILTNSLVASLLGLTRIDPLAFDLPFSVPEDSASSRTVEFSVPADRLDAGEGVLAELFNGHAIQAGRWHRRTETAALELVLERTGHDRRSARRIARSKAWRAARENDILSPAGLDPEPTLALSSPAAQAWLVRRLEGRAIALRPAPGEYVLCPDRAAGSAPTRAGRSGPLPVCEWNAASLREAGFGTLRFRPRPLLDLLDTATSWLHEQGRGSFDPFGVGMDDPEAFRLLQAGRTQGIPPLESPDVRRRLRADQPADLSALVKLLRAVKGTEFDLEQTLLAFACCAVKAAEPAAFYAAALTRFAEDAGQVAALLREACAAGIEIHPLDINCSATSWAPDGSSRQPALRPGLAMISGVTAACVREIMTVRREMTFGDLAEFMRRTDPRLVKAAHIERMVRAGAFDSFGFSRSETLAHLERLTPLLRPRTTRQPEDPLAFFHHDGAWWIENQVGLPDPEETTDTDSPEWTIDQETRLLGVPVTWKPWYLEQDYLADAGVMETAQLRPKHREEEVSLVGIPGAVQDVRDGGAELCVVELEGCLVEARPHMAAFLKRSRRLGRPVLVAGRLDREGEHWILRAELAEAPEDAARRALKTEALEVDLARLDARGLKELYALVKRYPGPAPVRLNGVEDETPRPLQRLQKRRVTLCPGLELGLNRIAGRTAWRAWVAADDCTPSARRRGSAERVAKVS